MPNLDLDALGGGITPRVPLGRLVRQVLRLLVLNVVFVHLLDKSVFTLAFRVCQIMACGTRAKLVAKRNTRTFDAPNDVETGTEGQREGSDGETDTEDAGAAFPQLRFDVASGARGGDSESFAAAFVCTVVFLNIPILFYRAAYFVEYFSASSYVELQQVSAVSPVFLDFFQTERPVVAHPLVLFLADAWVIIMELALVVPHTVFSK